LKENRLKPLDSFRRPGNAGPNTAADHIAVLDMAIDSLPTEARPGAEGGPRLLARAGSAGATHEFAAACRQRGVGFSFGFPVTEEVKVAITLVPEDIWEPATEADGEQRHGAYLAELTHMLDMAAWPGGPRRHLRPGATAPPPRPRRGPHPPVQGGWAQ
jgi:hypothetical protein